MNEKQAHNLHLWLLRCTYPERNMTIRSEELPDGTWAVVIEVTRLRRLTVSAAMRDAATFWRRVRRYVQRGILRMRPDALDEMMHGVRTEDAA